MTNELLTTEETANYLKISKRTLFRMIHKGKIRAIKLGNTYRFKQIELDADLGMRVNKVSTDSKTSIQTPNLQLEGMLKMFNKQEAEKKR